MQGEAAADGQVLEAPATFQRTLDLTRVLCYCNQSYTIFTRFHIGLAFEFIKKMTTYQLNLHLHTSYGNLPILTN